LALGAPIMLHLGLYGAGNGAWLSIAMFFTLSGFLITTLALKEIDRTGRLSIKAFYARRLRRLMPAALLVLTLTVVFASALDWPLMSAVRRDVFAALTWTANWEQLGGSGYWETTVPSLTLHFWSLSLEEQIYVVFRWWSRWQWCCSPGVHSR
jgi:peptidoglycan/LPS O-acetylase OafA/YrhL